MSYMTGPAADGHTHTVPDACCAPCARGQSCSSLGDFDAKTTIITLTAIGIGAAFLFPRGWSRFMDSLWG